MAEKQTRKKLFATLNEQQKRTVLELEAEKDDLLMGIQHICEACCNLDLAKTYLNFVDSSEKQTELDVEVNEAYNLLIKSLLYSIPGLIANTV